MFKNLGKTTIVIGIIAIILVVILAFSILLNMQNTAKIDELTSQSDVLNEEVVRLNERIRLNTLEYFEIQHNIVLIQDSLTRLKNEAARIKKKYQKDYVSIHSMSNDRLINVFTEYID